MPFSYHNGNAPSRDPPPRTIDGAGFGKVAIITGCSSGVGLATTQVFLSHQYEVLGVDVKDIDYAKIDSKDAGRFHFHQGDLMAEGECDAIVRICVAKFGAKIDVLANIAGVMDAFEAADVITDHEWERVMGTNLTVPTRMIRAVLPFMKAKKNGSIVNVASKAAVSGAAAGLAYTTSKHGLLGVTKHTAWRFHDEGIRCNAVLPGSIDTSINDSIEKENFDDASFAVMKPIWELHNPAGEKPSISAMEVANVILFLSSEGARAINGVALPIDKAWGVI
ncbi:NAD(P)-binding protein [Acephala macrosclerotiorum]|nr:NAD(P)-binding protein [Acephala macrosclerotiorum]